ncbi:hypothetical protein GBA52_015196 [Prunus armeniaca]|nr:hypothetical protein GBA52_015196 [Prunus armeniaca]
MAMDEEVQSEMAEDIIPVFPQPTIVAGGESDAPNVNQEGESDPEWTVVTSRKVNYSVLKYHDRFIHCSIHDMIASKDWLATFIYAFPQKEKQSRLWEEILLLKPCNAEP